MCCSVRITERLRGHAGVAQRKRRMLRSNYLCDACAANGITRKADVVDHIQPLSLGGSDDDENTRNLCNPCHTDAGADQFGYRKRVAIGVDGWPL
jgi:5-methylcytosine-specific restriction protein A